MGFYKIMMMALTFFIVLAFIILNLYLFNAHVDVQSPPYDTISHKKTINKFARLDVACPFIIAVFNLLSGQFLGILIMAPALYFSVKRIISQQMYMDATTNYKRIKDEELISILKVINLFVAWIYILIKFILTLVKDI
ncbi:Cornichon_protein [Hexamita inflata]|uniref:Cornichon protein n=1 Tax=Hexamita inflata TaxID=28002 RepID=A0AA86UDD4_9EUKA|nr:Cornichon protein [Hexamita inflata]CAI9937677.1 Cornichon protein [Hexamita inflata]CAI9938558.1 Cornichon protein [Hexamita inflata]CAI9944556.1 Cornichon protein [Hexamita inflata]